VTADTEDTADTADPAGTAAGDRWRRRGLRLAALTIAWNAAEAAVAVSAGIAAGSIALVGFGFDSVIEVLSSWVVMWQLRGELRGGYDEDRERRALRFIGITFFVLAGYVTVEAVRDLLLVDAEPEGSPVGIALAAVSLAVMPALAWAKRRTATRLGSPTLRADATETLLCSWLSAALLGGLVLNAAVGWWWADPLAALAIAALAVHEGLEALRGDHHDGGDHDHHTLAVTAARSRSRGARAAEGER
jgi:divalent metal cation (Fe/Co/Zn/Cd) transporter